MPLFTYIATNNEGKVFRGTIRALSAQAAREALKEMQLLAQELYETPEGRDMSAQNAAPLQKPAVAPAQEPVAPAATDARAQAASWKIVEERPSFDASSMPSAGTTASAKEHGKYFPLIDTLRLYAGWLLSWYFLIFAFGSYDFTRDLPVKIPLVSGLFQSPIIISFALGAFLFLLLTEIHKKMGKGIGKGLVLAIVGVGVFVLYRMNM